MTLSAREVQILKLAADGLENSEIGEQLHLERNTIKSHLQRIYEKLDARNRTHAVVIAIRRGWL